MGELVSFTKATERRAEDVNRLFDAYVAAKHKADATLSVEDGIAAAKIWKRFLELFCGSF